MNISKQSVVSVPFLILITVLGTVIPSNSSHHAKDQRWSSTQKPNTINAVIGDESYLATYGHLPTPFTPENKRIVTHLRYVKKKLSQRDVSSLTKEQKQRRQLNLDRLESYIDRGEFPQNKAFRNQHRPNFIDSDGNICAVGYLIAQSMGRDVAEKINSEYQYEYVLKIKNDLLESWAKRNGFTLRELAMIQPAYCYNGGCAKSSTSPEKIGKPTESVLIGANVGFSLVNGILGYEKSGNLAFSTAGLLVGASTVTLGLTNHTNFETTDYITGGIAMATSGWLLYSILNKDKSPSEQNLTVAPVASTRYDGNVGLSLNYRF